MKCPICNNDVEFTHAPDGRCDGCAEEYGCECGCYPPAHQRKFAEIHGAYMERGDDDAWVLAGPILEPTPADDVGEIGSWK